MTSCPVCGPDRPCCYDGGGSRDDLGGAFHDMEIKPGYVAQGSIMTDEQMREQYRTPEVEAENRRLHAGPSPTFYTTPPDFKKCMNYQEHGPTPCWHPHCNCFKFAAKYPDPWKTGRAETIACVAGVALVLSGFALLASSFFGYFR